MSKISDALEYSKYPNEFKKYMEAEAKLVRRFVKDSNRVLEVGFGTGRNVCDIVPYINEYIGIEVDKKSMEQAIANYTDDNTNFILLDARNLNKKFPKNYFDKTVCLFNTLSCIKSPVRALQKMQFVTKGPILITVQKKGNLKKRIKYYENFGISYVIDKKTETIISKVWGKSHSYTIEEIRVLAEKADLKVTVHGSLGEIALYAVLEKK